MGRKYLEISCYNEHTMFKGANEMQSTKQNLKMAMEMLKKTSRTFYIPISFLSGELKLAVATAYLCMRAIDEIEDHPEISNEEKSRLLKLVAENIRNGFNFEKYKRDVGELSLLLPDVTMHLGDWIELCPEPVRLKVLQSTVEMAEGMAKWAESNWLVETKEDLDEYTYYVAGLVGVMLSDLWEAYDNKISTDRTLAIAFGRGLQIVNILRNQEEDAERGVSYLPNGWSRDDLFIYAEKNLTDGKKYMQSLRDKRMIMFCKVPLALADKTLQAMKKGHEKMSRLEVEDVVAALEKEIF